MSSIAVIDYGMGNLRSVTKALEHVAEGARVVLTHDPAEIENASHVVFPGQGAARDCMAEIRRLGLDRVVRQVAGQRGFAQTHATQCKVVQAADDPGNVRPEGQAVAKEHPLNAGYGEGQE